MRLTESLAKLLQEHSRQEKHPSLWQDSAWKSLFYGHYNKVWDALNEIDQKTVGNIEGGYNDKEEMPAL